jgi:DNA-binding transcriptional MocR family regulator
MLGAIMPDEVKSRDGFDCRNYGLPFGLEEARELFAEILHVQSDRVIVGNNSSLSMMHDALMRALVFGEIESEKPWMLENSRKWLCPVPGYDRHFSITQKLGFTMIPVPMTEEGPDMDIVEKLVAEDSSIMGMWCLPLYSNPDGYVYSEKVCIRLASMKTSAKDFRILWDNAYVVHHLYADKRGSIPDILSLAERFGYPNRFYEFASTSKISFAGSGIACIASNPDNIQRLKALLSIQSIGPDKINQLRHVKYLKNSNNIELIMRKQAELILPKFEKTESILTKEFADTGIAKWNSPVGGYFISLFVMNGTAKKVVDAAKQAGVALTPAGATYPYGNDPDDSNIRIAPTFPSIEDIEKAVTVLCVCAKLTAVIKLLEE